MDDKTFESFIDVFTTRLALNNIYLDHSKEDVSIFLNQLKNQDEKEPIPPTYFTCFGSEPFPCLKDVIEMLLFLIDVLLLYFLSCLKTTLPTIK